MSGPAARPRPTGGLGLLGLTVMTIVVALAHTIHLVSLRLRTPQY
jgi:hypothetical protein